MSWTIQCSEKKHCKAETRVKNIVELINDHCDKQGWFLCSYCGNPGYVKRRFPKQEGGWFKPHLWGVITLSDDPSPIYQPFVFLFSDAPEIPPRLFGFPTTRTPVVLPAES